MKTPIYFILIILLSVANSPSGFTAVNLLSFTGDPLKENTKSVHLHTFEAVGIETGVSIRWISSYENNCQFFTIQRSSDGTGYTDIARMEAAGNSSSLVEYLIIDNDPLPGTSYYRVRYTNARGEYDHSESIVVIRNDTGDKKEIRIADTLYDFVSEDVILVRDKEGMEYFSKVILMKQGNEMVAFDNEGKIPPGSYFVIASSRNFLRSSRITVK